MTDRDRLIHKIMSLKKPTISLQTAMDIVDAVISEGVIVPPCKVGDWVWYVRDGKINKAKIEECIYSASKHGYFSEDWRFHAYNFSKKEEITFWFNNIGDIVFLTKEEAEAKLKEREGK